MKKLLLILIMFTSVQGMGQNIYQHPFRIDSITAANSNFSIDFNFHEYDSIIRMREPITLADIENYMVWVKEQFQIVGYNYITKEDTLTGEQYFYRVMFNDLKPPPPDYIRKEPIKQQLAEPNMTSFINWLRKERFKDFE